MLVGYCRLKKKRRSTITDLLRMTDTGGVHMEEYRLCNSDYRFMTLVWEHGPIGSGELVRLCAEYLGWKKSTTYTEIKRLSQKGVLKNENAVVTPLVTREEVQAKESDEFVERTFDGSLPGFLTAFLGRKETIPSGSRGLESID